MDYQAEIDRLVSGEIKELVIDRDHFLLCRTAWLAHPKRKEIVGEACLGGSVIYRYVPNPAGEK